MKKCTQCKTDKHLEEFTKRAASPDGRHSWCKECKQMGMQRIRRGEPHTKVKVHEEGIKHNLMKEKCVSCGNKIPLEWDHYLIRGNYCYSCSSDASSLARDPEHRKETKEFIKKIL